MSSGSVWSSPHGSRARPSGRTGLGMTATLTATSAGGRARPCTRWTRVGRHVDRGERQRPDERRPHRTLIPVSWVRIPAGSPHGQAIRHLPQARDEPKIEAVAHGGYVMALDTMLDHLLRSVGVLTLICSVSALLAYARAYRQAGATEAPATPVAEPRPHLRRLPEVWTIRELRHSSTHEAGWSLATRSAPR